MSSIAFVGAGPTTLYSLHALVQRGVRGARITVFEAQASAGEGSPYREDWNAPAMLANIASVEIPPIRQTLLDWLGTLREEEAAALGVDPAAVDDRSFVSRTTLGAYFRDQFGRVVGDLRRAGNVVTVKEASPVVDAAKRADGMEVVHLDARGRRRRAVFDHLVLATGHQWPSRASSSPERHLSPWPASKLADVPPVEVGVLGTSLTAIDAAVGLAQAHGAFERRPGGELVYTPSLDTAGFAVTLMSRKGLLPEADFYFPMPSPPLRFCTLEAVSNLYAAGPQRLLDKVFDLVRRELWAVDPTYAATAFAEGDDVEAFARAYFARRSAHDPFAWAEANVAEARANHAARITVPWRDALLRMHEVVGMAVPHMDDADFLRFTRALKPAFVDAYGAVPHETVDRLLALHRACRIRIWALGDDYEVADDEHAPGVSVSAGGDRRQFAVFIDAIGQRALEAIQFPFLTLLEQGVVRDTPTTLKDGVSRGVVIDSHYRVVADGLPRDRLFCLSLPFILGREPFAQGVTSSHQMGQAVGARLAEVVTRAHGCVDTLPSAA